MSELQVKLTEGPINVLENTEQVKNFLGRVIKRFPFLYMSYLEKKHPGSASSHTKLGTTQSPLKYLSSRSLNSKTKD